MEVNHVKVRQALNGLRMTTQAAKGRGMFAAWQAAEAEARAVYLSLFTDAEKALIIEGSNTLSQQFRHSEPVSTFEEAIQAHGTSIIDMALLAANQATTRHTAFAVDTTLVRGENAETFADAVSRAQAHLVAELASFCNTNGLAHISADELLLKEGLTNEQWSYLHSFIVRWNSWEDLQAASPAKAAAKFCELLRTFASDSQWLDLLRNTAQETDDGICHSQDLCDANMVMAEAFEKVVGREQFLDSDTEAGEGISSVEVSADAAFYDIGWTIAKKCLFQAQVCEAFDYSEVLTRVWPTESSPTAAATPMPA